MPLKGDVWVSNGWFYNKVQNSPGQRHHAVDFSTAGQTTLTMGTEVFASCDGVAIWDTQNTGINRGYGHLVLQRCDQTDEQGRHYFIIYAHLSDVADTIPWGNRKSTDYSGWRRVRRGELIGESGSSDTSWPHLHMEVFVGSYGAKANHRLDPYDLYEETSATRESRDYYPPAGALFEGCGPNHLWTQCPPVYQAPGDVITSLEPSEAVFEQATTFVARGEDIPSTAVAYIPDCAGLAVVSRAHDELVFSCTPRWRQGLIPGGVIKDRPFGQVLYTFAIQVGPAAPMPQPDCTADQEGQVLVPGNPGACGGFTSDCDETGTRTRTNGVCREGVIIYEDTSEGCSRNTDGDACGSGGRTCSNGQCVSTCNATDFWSPDAMSASDPIGTQNSTTIPATLEIEVRDKGSNGNLEFRVCKYTSSGADSNFQGSPIHVYFEDWSTHTDFIVVDMDVPTDPGDHCTPWRNVSNESSFSQGDGLGGQVRIVSPASVANDWGRWCTINASRNLSPGGTCWYINTPVITRTCR
jgi:hypothetical protein